MELNFIVDGSTGGQALSVDLTELVVAGWAGRDRAAIEHHIEELAAIGVPRPSTVPLYYRVAENLMTQANRIQVLGGESSGEVETFVFSAGGQMYVSLASDHTDRKLETLGVALSKQICAKPLARSAWRFAEVAGHWDEMVIRSYIEENGARVLYQEGPLAALRPPLELIRGFTGGATLLPEGTGMICGTVGAIGGIRPAPVFAMELFDPVLGRTIEHVYRIEQLPVVA
ncbi:DUF2848 domain-containing protein [Bradyrhizobium sp. LHD-71]|uniref:DUF2848 domain-containing protein n=1 Tax=Bradyrhizobium sp. LHD-71 TaxID=3072141 RepID=UPI00280D18CE|nr:DUF2848 domain-containing protein [Bradyrhizobium sp. LHD-71]MDQ8728982.1 DUF2848 domain-containing protein [Bradyrhizobium sp. LHD-71]